MAGRYLAIHCGLVRDNGEMSVVAQGETIAVAMSGGVDSSAVAALLRAEGHEVVGLTLQLWNQRRLAGHEGMPEAVQGRCCSIDDVYDARRVAEQLDIPYYLVNQQDRFEAEVVRPFVDEYLAGRTPIPCTLCNNHLSRHGAAHRTALQRLPPRLAGLVCRLQRRSRRLHLL